MIQGVPSSVVSSGTGTGDRQGAHRPVSPTQVKVWVGTLPPFPSYPPLATGGGLTAAPGCC